ncbi:Putative odorant receptor 94b [Papilio machaon]|uniref:Odorant receptor n=1 Tax=Papilio machaon TaxID=76193 RepID=A0A194RGK4_PAPMA|nr:Putative odorant receptor 94b [Papilio machaon]
MTSLVGTVNSTLRIPLTLFLVLGLWAPNHFQGLQKWLFNIYTFFSYMFLVGIDIAVQLGDLYQVWGNVPLMTATMFLIFTNLALSGKLINIVLRKTQLQTIIAEVKEELDAESSDEGIKCIALLLASALNVSMDTLVTSLICQCRCRLRLLALSLTTLCDNALVENKSHVSCNEEVVMSRLRKCIQRHQAALEFARHLQLYFSAPIFGQFLVSALIICVTAYQLAFESSSLLRFFTMVSCLLDMTLEVFLYCYHGNELLHESENIKEAAYACPWYYCSIPVRRMLLLLITRSYRLARLRAGGFTELSLTSFMGSENIKEAAYACPWYYCSVPVRRMLLLLTTRSYRLARLRAGGFTELSLISFTGVSGYFHLVTIIKASYTFFTVLQQVEE